MLTLMTPPARPGARLGTGIGSSDGHHGELVQGVFPTDDGPVPALVTLPCPLFGSTVAFRPTGARDLTVTGDGGHDYRKVRAAARLTLDQLGVEDAGGDLTVDSNIPRGRGLGSSTADVVAAIRAVAGAAGVALGRRSIAALAVRAESASDALMYEHPVLFAHTHGWPIEHFHGGLPAFRVAGVDLDVRGSGVSTDDFERPRYDELELCQFLVVRAGLRRAMARRDLGLLGAVATASTVIDQRHRPNRLAATVVREHRHWGGLGVQVAHSGTVIGVMVPPADAVERRDDPLPSVVRRLEDLAQTPAWSFDVGSR